MKFYEDTPLQANPRKLWQSINYALLFAMASTCDLSLTDWTSYMGMEGGTFPSFKTLHLKNTRRQTSVKA